MHPDDTALPIEFGLIGPVDAEQRVLLAFKQVERPRSERIFHAAIHMHRQAALSRQHFRRRGPSGPKRLPPDLGQSFPGEALAPDADPVLQRPPAALREIELAFARIDGERARRLARRIIDLLAGEPGHVDFIVETAWGRIVRIRVRRQKGLRVGRGRRAGQAERKIEQRLGRRLGRRDAHARKANEDETSHTQHGSPRSNSPHRTFEKTKSDRWFRKASP